MSCEMRNAGDVYLSCEKLKILTSFLKRRKKPEKPVPHLMF